MAITSFYDNDRMFCVNITDLLQGAASDAIAMPLISSVRVSITGTFGTATAIIQISNDGTNWNNVGASFLANASQAPAGMARFYRVLVTGGDGTTNLTARFRAVVEA